jgi:hypothetical protein
MLSDEVSTGCDSDRVNLRVKASPGASSNGSCNPLATAPDTDLMTGSALIASLTPVLVRLEECHETHVDDYRRKRCAE